MRPRRAESDSRGAVLLLCLLLLLALSLLGLAAASDRQLQDHINANVESAQQAEDIARLGSLWAQGWLLGQPGETRPTACAGDCPAGSVILAAGSLPANPGQQDLAWWQGNGHAAGANPASGETFAMPGLADGAEAHWLIEELHAEGVDAGEGVGAEVAWYRILARGTTGLPGSAAFSEAIVARPWGDAAWRDPFPPDSSTDGFCVLLTEAMDCGRRAWRQLR